MGTLIHVGQMLSQYITRKNLKRTALATVLGIPNTAIYAYEKRSSLQISNLMKFCHALRYNFFMDIANSLPSDYSKSEFKTSENELLIAQQAQEIERLKWENQLLKDLIKTR